MSRFHGYSAMTSSGLHEARITDAHKNRHYRIDPLGTAHAFGKDAVALELADKRSRILNAQYQHGDEPIMLHLVQVDAA